MTVIAYARVSTEGQQLDGQVEQLKAAGAEKVFREKISGAASNRKQLEKAVAALTPGDVLLVTRLDRLARSTRDLLNLLDAVSKKGASFKSLSDPWADTMTPTGRLMLTVLGGLAEFERSLIIARTSEGRERAMANGTRFGRKPKLTPHQRAELTRMADEGKPQIELAKLFGLHPSTVCGMLKEDKDHTVMRKENSRVLLRAGASGLSAP